MIGIVNDCNKLELSTFIETEDVKIHTNIGLLITNNYKLIIELCKRTFSKTTFRPSRNKDIVYSYENSIDNVNLVVTPANKLVFWDEHKRSENILVLYRQSMLTRDTMTKNHFLIVMSHTLFLQNVQFLRSFAFKRIIFHNVDTKHVDKTDDILYDFKWFVFSDDRCIHSHLLGTTPDFLSYILIKDTNDTIVRGNERVIACKKPIEVLTLDGLVDEVLMNNIKKGNIQHVIKHLVDKSIKREKDIIRSVFRVLNDKMSNCNTYEYCLKHMDFASDTDRELKLEQIAHKKNEITKKKSELIDRITENNLCFVCYSTIEIKCVMRCCVNKVCFECINRWARMSKNTCPLCKANKMEYYVVEEVEKKEPCCEKHEGHATDFSEDRSIFQNFRVLVDKLLKQGQSKVAVLGSDKVFIHRFEEIVRELEIPYVWFKGNMITLRKNLKRLNTDDINIIFIDLSKVIGALTIHTVTDIVVISEDTHVNETTLLSDNLKHVWRLVYT